ncbi:MAG: hypothetical protein FJX71_00805 [Alphaproteobacteria bacterium]|nr:hypothetical protein [Alphaproteobacteria bacterium]
MVSNKSIAKLFACTSLVALLSESTLGGTGIYAGAAIGGASLTGRQELFLVRDVLGLPLRLNNVLNLSDKSVEGDLFVGYGRRFNCFWLAAEAVAALTSLNSRNVLDITGAGSAQRVSTRTSNAWGGAFNIGYYFTQTQKFYLKIGFENRRFKVNFTDPTVLYAGINRGYSSTAFVPGAGIELDLTQRFSVRGEYRVALHGKRTLQAAGVTPQATVVQTKPHIQYINVGLVVKI